MKNDVRNKPLVSVIMPTYNHADYIGEAVCSVLSQTYRNLELIIVDNHSTDDTESIVKTFSDERIKYCRFDNKGIIASARNYGVEAAQGELLAFIDSDDVWLPDKLAKQMEYLSDGVSCTSTNFIPIGDIVYSRQTLSFTASEIYQDYQYEDIVLKNPIMTSSVLVRKSDYIELDGFDESAEFKFIEDWDFWLRLSRLGRCRVLSSPLIKYRVFKTKGRDMRDVRVRTIGILEKHRKLGYLDGRILETARGNCYVHIGKAFLDANDRGGVKYYRYGLRYSRGFYNKMRSLTGLLLFCLPFSLRSYCRECLYRCRARLTGYDYDGK